MRAFDRYAGGGRNSEKHKECYPLLLWAGFKDPWTMGC